MTAFSLDSDGEARLALEDIFRVHGRAGIDDGDLVDRHLPDLLPGAPREASLLRAAARNRVGRLLADRIDAQMPVDAAVRDVARLLAGQLAFDLAACLWVVSEYAEVLGHRVDVSSLPETGSPGTADAGATTPIVAPRPGGHDGTPDAAARQPASPAAGDFDAAAAAPPAPERPGSGGPAAGPGAPSPGSPGPGAAGTGATGTNGSGVNGSGSGSASFVDPRVSASPGGLPSRRDPWETTPLPRAIPFPPVGRTLREQPASGAARRRSRRTRAVIIGIGTAVAAVLITAGVVLALNTYPACGAQTGSPCAILPAASTGADGSAAPSSTASPGPAGHPGTATSPATARSSTPAIVPGGGPPKLASVMPVGVNVTLDDCASEGSTVPGTVAYYDCTEPASGGLSGTIGIVGYQFASRAGLDAGLAAFNEGAGFDPQRADYHCPPSDNTGGTGTWYRTSKDDPLGSLECYTAKQDGTTRHVYVWTSTHDFTIMLCETSDSFSHLETWWERHNDNDNGQVG